MKPIEEIITNPRIAMIDKKTSDGFHGMITMPKWSGSVICTYTGGWDHVSVSPFKKNVIPTWDDMCAIKDVFWKDDEAVIQVHPEKDMYVNNLPNCLHLWRCYYKEMVLPPSCFVGIRKGQTMAELEKEAKQAFELAGEVYE